MLKKVLCIFLTCSVLFTLISANYSASIPVFSNKEKQEYIKWVDFNITYEALKDAAQMDIETYEQDIHLNWIELLSCLGTNYGGDFKNYKKEDLTRISEEIKSGKTPDKVCINKKYYTYYHTAYSAVLRNILGSKEDGTYGFTGFSPIAAGFSYSDSDDFGNGRDYGFKRKHLGHDMFCNTGTPIIAVEGGTVEALGWNQYGGWRVGIRSTDGQRYYYYAHMRKDKPYADGIRTGQKVKAGQLIGYSGQSGYSTKPNVNNIQVPHLHFGLQLIFDESQKDCNSEIWINPYPLTRLLSSNRSNGKSDMCKSVVKTSPSSVDIPILMYHGLTNKSSQVNNYFIPVSTFESDLKYLKENGYTALTMSELINFVCDKEGKKSLPDKPVILTFDDGYCNNYRLATPLLKKYKMKAVISVIGSSCEEASKAEYRSESYCNITWEQLAEMHKSGLWEIQNHTYDLHEIKNGRQGASKKNGENEVTYKTMLKGDLMLLQEKIYKATGTYPNTFTWPYGAYPDDIENFLKDLGFKAALTCNGGINHIQKGHTENLFSLKRQLRTPSVNLESLLR